MALLINNNVLKVIS